MKRAFVLGICFIAATILGPRAVLANVVFEAELNDDPLRIQVTPIEGGSVTIHAELDPTKVGGDTDFFRFDIPAGNTGIVTFDVVDANGFSPVMAVFGPGVSLITHGRDTMPDLDGIPRGSNFESTLAAGSYTVGVTFFPRRFSDGGILDFSQDITGGSFVIGGSYKLIVSGVLPPVGTTPNTSPSYTPIPVLMEVRPGERNFVRLNPKSHATLKVAILSSDTFDAGEVDTETLTFGATGDEASLKDCRERMKDVNRDGLKDMICRFYTNKGGFEVGDQGVVLKGSTITGTQFESYGSLKVKYERRKHRDKGKHDGKHDQDDDDDDHDGKRHGKKGRD